ncbi:carboxypeptidase-like regulatory domain-containing protein [Ascidiimonas sp. W6]|uniref:carboxypeptidase-like regulatory domain-containing protein n=1 Tax=Ascidiimonas meishanensis TaxID=3128903 RepID=UPI0030ECCB39
MKEQINLEIKEPCSENFNNFKQTAKGGFCDSCQKEVIDFTKMNAQETMHYFKTHDQKNTCGKFYNHQLKTYQHSEIRNNRFGFLAGIGFAFLSLFSFNTTQAQDNNKEAGTLENDPSKIINQKQEKEILVNGTVSDYSGPLPGASVVLEGTTIGIQTDFDGNFTFPKKLKKGDVLVFSYVGFQSKKVVIRDGNSASKTKLNISMTMDAHILLGEIAVKKVFQSKKN